MTTLRDIVSRPSLLVPVLGRRGLFHSMRDSVYLQLSYKGYIGHNLDLNHPKTFNEKLQWLKLHDHNPMYTTLVDKYEVKFWVAKKIGGEYVVPNLGLWDSFDQIDFDVLPEKFVLKCTHDSGGLVICRDRPTFDMAVAEGQIKTSLARNYYWSGREWPYKDVRPRIIAEQYLDAGTGEDPIDYKFMCFNGKVKCIFTCSDRKNNTLKVDFFDPKWNKLPFTRHYPNSINPPRAPKNLDLLIKLSEILSSKIPFVRVDFYEVNGKIYFGEMTLYPGSGFEEFEPEAWDEKLGSWIDLDLVAKQVEGGIP